MESNIESGFAATAMSLKYLNSATVSGQDSFYNSGRVKVSLRSFAGSEIL